MTFSFYRSLQQAFSYARNPVESITRYETVSRIISNVVNQVNRTEKAVDNLTEFVSINNKLVSFVRYS